MFNYKTEENVYVLKYRNEKGEEVELRGDQEFIWKRFEDVFEKMKGKCSNETKKELLVEGE